MCDKVCSHGVGVKARRKVGVRPGHGEGVLRVARVVVALAGEGGGGEEHGGELGLAERGEWRRVSKSEGLDDIGSHGVGREVGVPFLEVAGGDGE